MYCIFLWWCCFLLNWFQVKNSAFSSHGRLCISTLHNKFSSSSSDSGSCSLAVIRTSLLLNGDTSAVVNWLVQTVTWCVCVCGGVGGCTDQIYFILKAYSLSWKARHYPLSQSQISPWLNAPVVNPDTISKKQIFPHGFPTSRKNTRRLHWKAAQQLGKTQKWMQSLWRNKCDFSWTEMSDSR